MMRVYLDRLERDHGLREAADRQWRRAQEAPKAYGGYMRQLLAYRDEEAFLGGVHLWTEGMFSGGCGLCCTSAHQ